MNTAPLPQLPAGLTEDDMPGDDATARAMNHALYRRGILPHRSRRALLKRLGLLSGFRPAGPVPATAGEG